MESAFPVNKSSGYILKLFKYHFLSFKRTAILCGEGELPYTGKDTCLCGQRTDALLDISFLRTIGNSNPY